MFRQTSEHFEEMVEVLSEELREVKNNKEDLLVQDKRNDEENQELWKEANNLQVAKERILSEDSKINKQNDILQQKFNRINEEKMKIMEESNELNKIFDDVRGEYEALSGKRSGLRVVRYSFHSFKMFNLTDISY